MTRPDNMGADASRGHTPGPWSATHTDPAEGYDCWWITACPEPNQEKEVATVSGGYPYERHEANARLIAAAPYMFDVLDATAADPAEMNSWSDEMVRGWAYAAARNAQSAIAKALGEQP